MNCPLLRNVLLLLLVGALFSLHAELIIPDTGGVHNMVDGQMVIHLNKKIGKGSYTLKLVPVKPSAWYRLSVESRNTVGYGTNAFGCQQSIREDKMEEASKSTTWRWNPIPLNASEWTTYSVEFQTLPTTKALRLGCESKNAGEGDFYFRNMQLESIVHVDPPLEWKKYRAVATYTDVPTRNMDIPPVTKERGFKVFWNDIDPDKEAPEMIYRDIQNGDRIQWQVTRGKAVAATGELTLAGSGECAVPFTPGKLAPGKYMLSATLVRNGAEVLRIEKELWRLARKDIREEPLEPIRKMGSANGFRTVNGKPFLMHFAYQFPSGAQVNQTDQVYEGGMDACLENGKVQFGFNVLYNWCYRHPAKWQEDRQGFVAHAVKTFRFALDAAWKHGLYVWTAMPVDWKHFTPEAEEEFRQIIRGIHDHPAQFQYYSDEPDVHDRSPEVIEKLFNIIQQEAPEGQVIINLCKPLRFHEYMPFSHIASYDNYPFPGLGLMALEYYDGAMDKCAGDRPRDSYLQMFSFDAKNLPAFREIKAEFLHNTIHGVRSLTPFTFACGYRWGMNADQELQSYYRALNMMFRKLVSEYIDGTVGKPAVASDSTSIRAQMISHPDRDVIVIVNADPTSKAVATLDTNGRNAVDFFDDAWEYTHDKGKITVTLPNSSGIVLRLAR